MAKAVKAKEKRPEAKRGSRRDMPTLLNSTGNRAQASIPETKEAANLPLGLTFLVTSSRKPATKTGIPAKTTLPYSPAKGLPEAKYRRQTTIMEAKMASPPILGTSPTWNF